MNGFFSRYWPRVEMAIAVVLLACCVLHTGRMMTAMATTSLSTDEFGSIGGYSRHGPIRVMTDYSAPKNHIFFSLLNSLLPDRASLNPARARLLSLVAAALFVATVIAYSAARGALLEGAVILTLWTFSLESLELCLQARGYGFLALAALWCCVCTTEYFRTGRSGWLHGNAVAVTLGTYSVPGFLFFGAPLLLLVWATGRNRQTFFPGLAAGIAIALLYSPVALQVYAAFSRYGALYESDFKYAEGIVRAVNLYLFSSPDWTICLFLVVLSIAPFLADGGSGRSHLRGERVVMGAALIFFGALLYVRTSPVRMANMGMVPFAFAGVFALGAMIRAQPPGVRAACFGLVGVLMMQRILPRVRTFEFTPHEDWSLAGKAFDNAFDSGVHVNFAPYAKYLGHTIHSPERRSAPLDERAYVEGRLVVADAGNKWAEGRRFFRPKGEAHNAEIVIMGATRDIVLTFQIPVSAQFTAAPRELIDRDSTTGIAPAVQPVSVSTGEDLHTVVFLMNRAVKPAAVRVVVKDSDGSLDGSGTAIYAGNAIIVPMSGSARGGRERTIELKTEDASFVVVEAWTVSDNR